MRCSLFLGAVILLTVPVPIRSDIDLECSPNLACISSLTQADCPDKQYIVANAGACGRCPGCVGGLEFGYFCSANSPCAPGLTCVKDKCALDKTKCSYTYHLKHLKLLPECEFDGTFAAVQCKGDRIMGRCFCYSETGQRIFGWAWRRNADTMSCACSRKKYKLIQSGHIDNTLHCDQKGNYEPLQCSNGMCWCANPTSGEIVYGTRAVPESMWTFLPCYDIVKMGLRYLRQCESAAYAQHVMQNALAIHGTTNVEFKRIVCDYDGAYGIYQVVDGIVSCRWRDGMKIGSFQEASNKISQVNCNCARDQKIFERAGVAHTLACNGNGNYEYLQDVNGKLFCVDRDGFAVTDAVTFTDPMECKKYIYYEITELPDSDDYNGPDTADEPFAYPDYY